MSSNPTEIQRRESVARAAIKNAFGKPEAEWSVTLFVTHHLGELDSSYWIKHLSTGTPEQHRVLELLELRSHWGGDDEIENFDFTLPDEITNYVISVNFDEEGNVSEISMES
ncbi:DUF2004 domain-containing protein [Planctomicrobium piriforme]|uniref:DUF2004 domain-containing protein n=1 Tax=Planctomicrobium piriforme TaxID=1576369 RepID=A0A1I3MUE9_9PLAN|nr:DUF2004 domain-containing protein [Planctomicrobium piriforme]SFJ00607.1 Protein of unknown function [Planctomicrobium piriforme]